MRSSTNFRCSWPIGLLLMPLGGCAAYQEAPLPAALRDADANGLAVDAAKLDRPFLKPVTIDLAAPLTANALAVIAVLESPDLKALRAKTRIVDAQAFAARLLPDPTVQGSVDKLLSGPDAFTGFAGQIGLDLNQLRLARVARAASAASMQQIRLDVAWAEWQTSGQARLQGARVVALQAQLAIVRQTFASADQLYAATARAVARGDLGGTELDTRRQARLVAATALRTAETALTTAQGDLNKLLGLPPTLTLRLAPPSAPLEPPSASLLQEQALGRRLDLQALRAGYAGAEADLHRNILQQFPTLSLTLAYARDTANNRTLGPQVGFTLPLWNRNRGGIAVSTATRAQLRAEYEARLFQTRADINAAVAALAAARRQRTALVVQLPAIAAFADANARAARAGDIAAAAAETAAQALRDRQLELLQLDQQIAEQTIALELLSGGPSEGWTQ